MIKILLHGFFDPIPDLSPRTVSALALRARADTVYSGWDQGWDQKTRVIIYMTCIPYFRMYMQTCIKKTKHTKRKYHHLEL